MYIWTSLIIQDNFPVVKKSNIVQHFFGGGEGGGSYMKVVRGASDDNCHFYAELAVPLLTQIAALGKQQDGDNSSLSLKLSSLSFFIPYNPLSNSL